MAKIKTPYDYPPGEQKAHLDALQKKMLKHLKENELTEARAVESLIRGGNQS